MGEWVGATATTTTGRSGPAHVVRLRLLLLAGLALALVLGAVLVATGTASAAEPTPPVPYGGALDRPDPGEQVTGEQVLEVSMLVLGTLNGLAFAGAVIASKMRGSSNAATRRALINRTEAGRPSGRRRRPAKVAAGRGPAVAPAPGPVTALGGAPSSGPLPVPPMTSGPLPVGPPMTSGPLPVGTSSGPLPVGTSSGPVPVGRGPVPVARSGDALTPAPRHPASPPRGVPVGAAGGGPTGAPGSDPAR